MTSRLVVNSVRHTGASADALTLRSDGKVAFPNNTGNILQVVSTTKTDTSSFASNTTNTFVDLSGLSVSITPTSASSKILIEFDVSVAVGTGTVHVRLVRGSTPIAVGDSASNRLQSTVARRSMSSVYSLENTPMSMSFLDSPNTTSATTYKIQMAVTGSTSAINAYAGGSQNNYFGISMITAYEVSA